jgi:hypothetical protein
LHRNDLTAEIAEIAEKEKREMNDSDANGKDIIGQQSTVNSQQSTVNSQQLTD